MTTAIILHATVYCTDFRDFIYFSNFIIFIIYNFGDCLKLIFYKSILYSKNLSNFIKFKYKSVQMDFIKN